MNRFTDTCGAIRRYAARYVKPLGLTRCQPPPTSTNTPAVFGMRHEYEFSGNGSALAIVATQSTKPATRYFMSKTINRIAAVEDEELLRRGFSAGSASRRRARGGIRV